MLFTIAIMERKNPNYVEKLRKRHEYDKTKEKFFHDDGQTEYCEEPIKLMFAFKIFLLGLLTLIPIQLITFIASF